MGKYWEGQGRARRGQRHQSDQSAAAHRHSLDWEGGGSQMGVWGRPKCGAPAKMPTSGGREREHDRRGPEWCREVVRFLSR